MVRHRLKGNVAKMEMTLCNIQTSFQGPLQTTYCIYTMKYLGSTFPSEHIFKSNASKHANIWWNDKLSEKKGLFFTLSGVKGCVTNESTALLNNLQFSCLISPYLRTQGVVSVWKLKIFCSFYFFWTTILQFCLHESESFLPVGEMTLMADSCLATPALHHSCLMRAANDGCFQFYLLRATVQNQSWGNKLFGSSWCDWRDFVGQFPTRISVSHPQLFSVFSNVLGFWNVE